jgi:hypothetical protein
LEEDGRQRRKTTHFEAQQDEDTTCECEETSEEGVETAVTDAVLTEQREG